MFGNVGWAEIVVLLFAALFVLGPERLPGAAAWLGRTVKQVREYATGARQQLKDELGPEFDELRKPLADLQQLRGLDPRTAITRHLFDGDASPFLGDAPAVGEPVTSKPKTMDPATAPTPLAQGERPPFDADAT